MAKKKEKLMPGDYVQVKKGVVGVVTGLEINSDWDEDGEPIESDPTEAFVATVDQDGDNDNNLYTISKLTKVKAPEYVVVWTDEYSDPFTQFSTKPEAEAFAKKLRKNKNIVEVRVYKLTK